MSRRVKENLLNPQCTFPVQKFTLVLEVTVMNSFHQATWQFSKKKILIRVLGSFVVLYIVLTLITAWILPDFLLKAWTPPRTDTELQAIRSRLCPPGDSWSSHTISGGEGVPLELHWLHRSTSHGVVIHLHGAFDDAWGSSSPRLQELPDWDAVLFTFRGRDRHPEVPCTLGAWERFDVVAVVKFLESQGIPRKKIVIVGNSMGAGIALLALHELEKQGVPLGGALLESPFRDLWNASNNHLRSILGPFQILARPALAIGLQLAGKRAHFNPDEVSPLKASKGLQTPVALVTGTGDDITPVEGVQAIARNLPDLTIIPGACHMCAGGRIPGGWQSWADERLKHWSLVN